ncbi:MAG: hypothetical protein DHS20C12_23600 [Pseudohongiella sp.]|nr:MAG: hypothetical protein DHS20C12_23600 [Pseudohongiella sp.]
MTPIRKHLCTFLFALFLGQVAVAQEATVTIEDFGFLQGYWQGTGFGGQSEEIWMPAIDGRMFGIFKQSQDGDLVFTEFMEIVQTGDDFVLRLKHFNPDFTGWEEKDDNVSFNFTSVSESKAVFGGLSYELVDKNSLQVKLNMRDDDGNSFTETFDFKRSEL